MVRSLDSGTPVILRETRQTDRLAAVLSFGGRVQSYAAYS
jgi:hypothetical protein